ncbi:MAG: DUF4244 domain-containing protein [Acidothermales bacterium]|nr:DUF4244 domain-containing protein [Acidothermales bacterium]
MVRHVRSSGRAVEAGMATAEYAVGTVAAVGLGGILYKLLTSSHMVQLLDRMIREGWLDMHVGAGS